MTQGKTSHLQRRPKQAVEKSRFFSSLCATSGCIVKN